MPLAYLDCFSGVSGDMFLGALVANGLDAAALEAEVRKLGIDVRLRRQRVQRGMLMAEQIIVETPPQHHHRHYTDIVKKIESSSLSAQAKQRSLAVFERLGRAEAKIHGVPLERVHFHEVGALDSIADIVGACAGIELLGIDDIRCSPLNVGAGTVKCDHGVLPVPAPATAELLQGLPVYSSGIQAELVTPTGAALVSTLASSFGPLPPMTISSSGYGAGSRDLGEFPNVLRMFLGSPLPASEIRAAGVSQRAMTCFSFFRNSGSEIRNLQSAIELCHPEDGAASSGIFRGICSSFNLCHLRNLRTSFPSPPFSLCPRPARGISSLMHVIMK